MSRTKNRVSDSDIIKLNSVGLSLNSIATALGCHPTTVTLRLNALHIEPTDTRRSFMEDVILSLDPDIQNWLVEQVSPDKPIKLLVQQLIEQHYNQNQEK